MQELPLEVVERVVQQASPSAVIALTGTSTGFRQSVISLNPVLDLHKREIPWNTFAASPYTRVRDGRITLPVDNRLTRASRRVQGDFPFAVGEDDPLPEDVFQCLYARALLYPQSSFTSK